MKIACLGWGSLIWKPDVLPLAGNWQADGPLMQIEFCRIGDGGELATAICPNAAPIPVFWAWMSTSSLALACQSLRKREGIPDERVDGLGMMLIGDKAEGGIERWAHSKGIEALIWTGLPARVDFTEGRIPSVEEVLNYLQQLSGDKRAHARSYIEQVPAQIDTPYRRAIAETLGWHHANLQIPAITTPVNDEKNSQSA